MGQNSFMRVLSVCGALAVMPMGTAWASSEKGQECEVIVAGGSTAALSAALTAAREGRETCLLEPTDWPGGQLTAAGVPAVDFAWHKVDGLDVAAIGRDPINQTPELRSWLQPIGNPGGCWVSRHCFEPRLLLERSIFPALRAEPRLHVFLNTVVKRVVSEVVQGTKVIVAVEAVERQRRPGAEGDLLMSQELDDWYSPEPSSRFAKRTLVFSGPQGRLPVVIDATEFGDVMVLSGAAWTQGVERSESGLETHCDNCGQAFVFTFVERLLAEPGADPAPQVAVDHPESYGFGNHNWEKIWTYRRLKGSGVSALGQVTLQNWLPGNDYPYDYFFRNRADTLAEAARDWRGGVNLAGLEAAERHAYGWHHWFKSKAGARAPLLVLDTEILGTSHGLAKMPYLRDVRRSIGVGGFRLTSDHLVGRAADLTGKRFIDRVATGAYALDIHPMIGVRYPDYVYEEHKTLPFYLPLRALTNRDVGNLLVAGKNMAQTFLANAATRLHPIEFSSGIGAGAAAAFMAGSGCFHSSTLLNQYAAVQNVARKYTPIDWTIGGISYPRPGESLD